MPINLKTFVKVLQELTPVKAHYENENQIVLNGILITFKGTLAKCSRITTRFETLNDLINDLAMVRILHQISPEKKHEIIARYHKSQYENIAIEALLEKYKSEPSKQK